MEKLKKILTDFDNNKITKHQAYTLICDLLSLSKSFKERMKIEDCQHHCNNECECVGDYCQYHEFW